MSLSLEIAVMAETWPNRIRRIVWDYQQSTEPGRKAHKYIPTDNIYSHKAKVVCCSSKTSAGTSPSLWRNVTWCGFKAVDYSIANRTDIQIIRTAQVLTAICTLRELSAITLSARDRVTQIAWQRKEEWAPEFHRHNIAQLWSIYLSWQTWRCSPDVHLHNISQLHVDKRIYTVSLREWACLFNDGLILQSRKVSKGLMSNLLIVCYSSHRMFDKAVTLAVKWPAVATYGWTAKNSHSLQRFWTKVCQ
jgi:hypothetical protein